MRSQRRDGYPFIGVTRLLQLLAQQYELELVISSASIRFADHVGVEPKIGVPPNHPFVHRVWNHYFHHPFWGKTPVFLVQHGGSFSNHPAMGFERFYGVTATPHWLLKLKCLCFTLGFPDTVGGRYSETRIECIHDR